MSIGYFKLSRKTSDGSLSSPISLPKGKWIEVARIQEVDLLGPLVGLVEVGPAMMSGELYGTMPSIKPPGAEARWIRHPDDEPNPTKHTGLVVGTETTWEALVPGALEYLTHEDFPLALFVKQTGSVWPLHTAIAAIFAPTLYAAARQLVFR